MFSDKHLSAEAKSDELFSTQSVRQTNNRLWFCAKQFSRSRQSHFIQTTMLRHLLRKSWPLYELKFSVEFFNQVNDLIVRLLFSFGFCVMWQASEMIKTWWTEKMCSFVDSRAKSSIARLNCTHRHTEAVWMKTKYSKINARLCDSQVGLTLETKWFVWRKRKKLQTTMRTKVHTWSTCWNLSFPWEYFSGRISCSIVSWQMSDGRLP